MESKKIIINGLLVNYYSLSAKESSKTLVFLHGWGGESQNWLRVIKSLANQPLLLVAIDLPGFGRSQTLTTPFNLDDYALIVDGFIKKMGWEKIVLVGHSFGGRITIKLAAQNPTYLEKIVLVDSAGIEQKTITVRLKAVIAHLLRPLFKPVYMQRWRKKIYALIGSGEYLAIPQLAKTFSQIVAEDLSSVLTKIKLPALIIQGENDTVTPLTQAKFIHQGIENSSLKIVKDASHFSFLDQPDQFIKLLKLFI